jgi:hypothetical protein
MLKKQIIQIFALIFFLYLGVFRMMIGGWEYYDVYGLITLILLSGLYVIYSQKNQKIIEYFRIFLYFILGFLIYVFIDNTFGYGGAFSFYSRYFGYTSFQSLYVILTGFDIIYILMISAILLFNRPTKLRNFRIGKLNISF